jgi:TRAP-type C4-dicarboxylate transport system permease small subunit
MTPRLAFRISTALATAYVLWVLFSLVAQRAGYALGFKLGDVGEFLLVLAATGFFVAGLALGEIGGQRHSAWRVLDDNAERYAMLLAYVFVCVVIVQEVIRRFLLNYSSAWSQETAQYLFIYLGYIGAAYAVKERAHIRFDILLLRASPRIKGCLYVFGELATLLFAVIAIYWSMHTVQQLLHFGGTTPVLRVNKTWFEAAVPIGFALVVIRCVQAIWRDVSDIRHGRDVFVGKAMFDE